MDENERPNGQTATAIGWFLIAGGVLCAFLAGAAESMERWWLLIASANLGVGVGVLLVSLGYLVKAIWFLPGRETSAQVEAIVEPSPCEWCGQIIALPNKPCAAFETERLKTFIPRITNEKCLVALREQNLISAES